MQGLLLMVKNKKLEVLRNDEEDSVRMVPLFDQGVSLLFSTYGDEKLLKEIDN